VGVGGGSRPRQGGGGGGYSSDAGFGNGGAIKQSTFRRKSIRRSGKMPNESNNLEGKGKMKRQGGQLPTGTWGRAEGNYTHREKSSENETSK